MALLLRVLPKTATGLAITAFVASLVNVVVASQGGLPRNPQWYANLAAHPDTSVRLKGERDRPVRARTATPDERDALWPRLVDLYADFAKYQKWTDREIPVVLLEPAPGVS